MSAIGGSGGNGGDSNPLGMLQGILDPMGLMQGLAGGIGKLFQGDTSGIEQMGKGMLNKVSSFGQSQGGMGGFDPSQSAAQTGWRPSQDQRQAAQGFAPDVRIQAEPPSHSVVRQDPSDRNSQRAQSSQAATAATEPTIDAVELRAKQDEYEALTTVHEKFSYAFDQHFLEAKDGFFHKGNLEKLAYGPQGVPDDVRKAAKYLLAHPEVMAVLERSSASIAGSVSHAAVATRALELKHELKNATAVVVNQGNTPPGVNIGIRTVDEPGATPVQSTPPPPVAQNSPPIQPSTPPINTPASPPPKPGSLDDRIASMSGNLDKLQDRLAELLGKETAGTITPKEKEELAKLPTQLQRAANRMSEMHSLISNLMAAYHQMSMGSIGHIR